MAIGAVILECFVDYVGIQSCEDVVPGSGLYVSNLPGISNAVIQAATDKQHGTYLVTWANIQERAILAFRNHLLNKINECYKINKMDTVECLACENKELFALALQNLLGNYVMIEALFNWNNSRFSTVDKKGCEEIRDYYFDQFVIQLASAVKGIDILQSDCIVLDNQCRITPNGRLSYQESLM